MQSLLVLAFTALTVVCWGNYGPLMHQGVDGMDGARLKPFVCVGLAYFLIAVVVPISLLRTKGEQGGWTVKGTFWSLLSGAVGAIGALGIIMAFNFGGKPIYVMPLVFGCAPVVNTFVTMTMNKNLKEAGTLFITGVLLVALGAAGVLYFKPSKAKPANIEEAAAEAVAEAAADAERKEEVRKNPSKAAAEVVGNVVLATLSIALTAVCWGCYGPVLHKGQSKMNGSKLRPLLCVGLAYFGIAVVAPMLILSIGSEPGSWFPKGSPAGFLWSMGAGAAGAFGALGIIMSFNFGGKPIFVMPLVFGCAPVVNTFTTMFSQGTFGDIQLPFVGSLSLVIAGAVMVLVFSPKGHKPPAKKDEDGPREKQPASEHAEPRPAAPSPSGPADAGAEADGDAIDDAVRSTSPGSDDDAEEVKPDPDQVPDPSA